MGMTMGDAQADARARAAIYIAARFSQRPECNALAQALKAQGHRITSRWVKPDADHVLPTGLSRQAEDIERRRFAMEDCADVRACDWVVSLQGEPRSGGRGGRHVEFGYGKRMISIGPRETVFHHMDEVQQFGTTDEFLAWSEHQYAAEQVAQAIPPGWRLVPIEPTEAMWAAAQWIGGYEGNSDHARKAHNAWWRAMLSAAPTPTGDPA